MLSAVTRGAIPFIIMSIFSGIMKLQHIDDYSVTSTFITGLIITAVAATSVIYDVESWSLTRQSVAHFLIMLVTVYPCLVFSGWFQTKSILDLAKIFGLFGCWHYFMDNIIYVIWKDFKVKILGKQKTVPLVISNGTVFN
ncbi:DUF3021 family protein [Lactobacillus laiwuensis]|uniref:DUF3021 family protein n=1 Tax=Lactobacillus laiwuensis TaxID=2841034 RepID=UPI0040393842